MNFEKKFQEAAEKKATALAKEAEKRLAEEYAKTIEDFYDDYPEDNYHRNYKLRKSYIPFYKWNVNKTQYSGGIRIGAMHMSDYPAEKGIRGKAITSERLFNHFIYYGDKATSTYHGGDYHGGYGKQASFSIYEHMHEFHEDLKNEFRERARLK